MKDQLPKNTNWKRFLEYSYYQRVLLFHFYRVIPYFKNAVKEPSIHDIKSWIDTLHGYENIVVVASGPSAKYIKLSKNNLYITTNSAIKLLYGCDLIYYLSDPYFCYKTLKFGVTNCVCKGVVFRQEFPAKDKKITELTKKIIGYKSKFRRDYPELLITNYEELSVNKENFGKNFEYITKYIKTYLKRDIKQLNSGFGTLYLGYLIAHRFRIPLFIYGLDAGEGGKIHFDGVIAHKTIFDNHIRKELTSLLIDLYNQKEININNFSHFMPNKFF